MKAKDMREKSAADLAELEKSIKNDAFQARFKNFTNRLDDTSALKKARRDIARVKTILTERAKKDAAPAAVAAPKAAAKAAPKATKAAAAPKAAAKTAKAKSAGAKAGKSGEASK